MASIRRSYSGHGVSSKQETSGSSCTSRLIIFEEHPSDTQRVPTGFLLELVHLSTPPFVSGTVRSRPLAAMVSWRLLPLFRRPAMAPRRFYVTSLGCSRGHGTARGAGNVTTRRASSPPSGCLHALGSSALGSRQHCQSWPPRGPNEGAEIGHAILTLRSPPPGRLGR